MSTSAVVPEQTGSDTATIPVMSTTDGQTASEASVSSQAPLVNKTLFLEISFGLLGEERVAKGEEANIVTPADKSLLRVKKKLFVSPEFKEIRKADANFRTRIKKLCIEGVLRHARVVPHGKVDEIQELCIQHKTIRQGLVSKFKIVYPDLYKQAELLLGPMFKAIEYPHPDVVENSFKFDYNYVSFEVPGALKSINGAVYQEQVAKSTAIMQNAAEKITETRRALMAALVSKLQEELTPGEGGEEKRFHKSAITKLQTFLTDFNIMDVTNDAELAGLAAKCNALVSGITAANVKESDVFKDTLLKGISEIGAALKPLVEDKGRKLKTVE